ncbi:unnamed protein product [Clavelina lepadiformis]|uniref:PPM-type phosphatase domain-containing protein n=1 Tax=Clavelina lepadiformis TaxID=159417 RepID=A0ABP0GY69_CLALP
MSPTNCWNLRVTAEVNQGGRKYMEDVTSVQFERVKSGKVVVEYAAFAIFDGHGGKDAAYFARDHLLENIKMQKGFFSNDVEVVKKAISDAFVSTHLSMWNRLHEWPKTSLGHPSTAGTTASLVIIRGNRMYVANVGDSMIVMGSRDENDTSQLFAATDLTIDHKPELLKERKRIEQCGGCVMNKSGVNRVVWSRPKLNHSGPIRRSTKLDKIPFLAVARSLGDLWSYNSELDKFVVSPVPDVYVYDLHKHKEQFVVLASDGLWNMIRPQEAVSIVAAVEGKQSRGETTNSPAHELVKVALDRWCIRMMRADNTSVIVVIIERRKIETSKRKDTYFESWTSARDDNSPTRFRDSEKMNNETGPTSSCSFEPLQDSSISSSSGDGVDEAASDLSKESKTAFENQPPSCSGTLEKKVTRSHSGEMNRRRKSESTPPANSIKTRRVSCVKSATRSRSEGQTMKLRSIIRPRRSRRIKKSL